MSTETETPLPPYRGILLADVRLVHNGEQARQAMAALLAADAIGFDTESKPTFLKGESSTGPHLIQLSTDDTAYLFQIGAEPALDVLKAILESNTTLKVGFGLSDDLKRLRSKLGIATAHVLDLSVALRGGQRNDLGAKSAVAKFFGLHLQKSKKISTTNWSTARLSEKQILYAADDAQVALRVYRRWIADGGKVAPVKAPRAAPPVAPN
ncbi:3'-5' exonuclease [Janthinobacterium sp.]|uniref:3'-5' exonuclease n=1 Tax=Janthinobacterium sp. TaxID=1871054 RepID=UPI00293D230A|nr:3'-5' exonuclease [Janthinobacterium sp.]